MDLRTYMKKRGLTSKEFAKIAGLSESTVCKYLRKKRLPDLLIAMEIERITLGDVKIADLIKYFKSDKEDK